MTNPPTGNRKCAHVPCRCKPAAGSQFCSDQCERAGLETDCNCGHAECGAEAASIAFSEEA